MADQAELQDIYQFLEPDSSSRGSMSSQSESTGTSIWDSALLSRPATSPRTSQSLLARTETDVTINVDNTAPVVLSFMKGSKLFKLKYPKLDICKDNLGFIKCVELSDPSSMTGSFIHTFNNSKKPIPHLEQPSTSTSKSFCVSFLEESMVQLAGTIFNAQPRYTFERDSDCTKFQEAILGVGVLFVAGVAEIVSKGRGEEAISQNIRICRTHNGRLSLLFFSNSQKDRKRYSLIPFSDFESYEMPKKASKPIHIKLSPVNATSAQLKALSITFIDSSDASQFCYILKSAAVKSTGR